MSHNNSTKTGTLTNPRKTILIRIWMNQFFMSVTAFAAMLLLDFYIGPSSNQQWIFTGNACQLIASCVFFLFFAITVYVASWQFGFRDFNVVKCGFTAKDSLRGLKIGVLALIPSVVLWLAALMASLVLQGSVLPLNWFEALHYIFRGFFMLIRTPYLYVLALAVVPLLAHWGYLMGYQNDSLMQRIMYQKPLKDTDRRLK